MNGVTEYLQTYRSMLYTDANGEEKTAYVIVPQDTSRMADYVNLSSRDGKNTYVMDDSGVIITEKLAKTLGVSVGDTVILQDERDRYRNRTRKGCRNSRKLYVPLHLYDAECI